MSALHAALLLRVDRRLHRQRGVASAPVERLDFDRVDAVRASCDAILVGAETVRIDNPGSLCDRRLVVMSGRPRPPGVAMQVPATRP